MVNGNSLVIEFENYIVYLVQFIEGVVALLEALIHLRHCKKMTFSSLKLCFWDKEHLWIV